MKLSKIFLLTTFFLLILNTTGCVQTYSTPSYAQSGGMVQVGLGGIKRNASSSTISASDVTATIKDSTGAEFPLTVSYVFRAYPDNASRYIIKRLDPNYTGTPINSITVPYDGGWYANIFLKNPDTYQPLPVATGAATIKIQSSKLLNTKVDCCEGDLLNIKVNIIAGVANPDIYQTEQFFYYTPMPHLTVRPVNLNNSDSIGGLQLKLNYSKNTYPDSVPPQVVPVSHDPNIHIISKHQDNGDGTASVIVSLTNPNGFVSSENWSLGKSNFTDLYLMIVPYSGIPTNWQSTISIDSENSFYIDNNGNPLANTTPLLEAGMITNIGD